MVVTHLCLITWTKSLLFNCKYRSGISSARQSITSRQRVFITPWNFGSRKNTAFKNLSGGTVMRKLNSLGVPSCQSHPAAPPTVHAAYLSARGGKPFTALFKHTMNLSCIVFWCCLNCFITSSHTDSSRAWKIEFLFKYTKVETWINIKKVHLDYLRELEEGMQWCLLCQGSQANDETWSVGDWPPVCFNHRTALRLDVPEIRWGLADRVTSQETGCELLSCASSRPRNTAHKSFKKLNYNQFGFNMTQIQFKTQT